MKETEYDIHYNNFEKIRTEGVYLIRNLDNNKLKIGKTNNLTRRLNDIKSSFRFCGNIPDLKVECFIEYDYSLKLEQYLHKQLEKYNYQNEWFSINDIDIILEELNKFEYIKPIKEDNYIHKNKTDNKIKVSKYAIDYYKYYRYKLKDYKIDCIVYLKRKKVINGIYEDISYVATSVGYMWNSYYMHDEELEELDYRLDNLDEIFVKFNTDSLAFVNDTYMRLDVYLGNRLRNLKIESLIENKNEIIDILDNIINANYNINEINEVKSDILDIEDKLTQVQEYLNESIEQHRRKF